MTVSRRHATSQSYFADRLQRLDSNQGPGGRAAPHRSVLGPSGLRASCLPQASGSAPCSLRARPLAARRVGVTQRRERPARGLARGRLSRRGGRPALHVGSRSATEA
jgi:hypothetical protein